MSEAFLCRSCNTVKPVEDFHKSSRSKRGVQSRCKSCDKVWHAERYARDKEKIRAQTSAYRAKNKDKLNEKSLEWRSKNKDKVAVYQKTTNLRKNFGIDIGDYRAMHAKQNGVCAICGKPETKVRLGKVQTLAVDHCHTTGVVRGLLCHFCNTALGSFFDDTQLLLNAVRYLEKHVDGYAKV